MLHFRPPGLSPSWRFALVGAIASLPFTVLLHRLPDSDATTGGGMMIVGAFVAGVVAATRSSDPSAAGLRVGFIGFVIELATFVVTEATTATWPLSRIAFWILAGTGVACVTLLFGMGFGRAGGWLATTVSGRWTSANVS